MPGAADLQEYLTPHFPSAGKAPIIYIMSSSTLRIASDESIAPIPRIRTKSFHFPKIPRNLRSEQR
jgi:hypothetical protein